MPNEQESDNERENFNFKNLCRVCLSSASETINIFTNSSLNDTTVGKVIQFCTDIEIQCSDNHPHCICVKCLKLLESAYTFKNVLIKSNLALKENETYDNEATLNTIKMSIEESHIWKTNLDIFRKDCTYDYLKIIINDNQHDIHQRPSTDISLSCQKSNNLNHTGSKSISNHEVVQEIIYTEKPSSDQALITNSALNASKKPVADLDQLPTEIISIEPENNPLSNDELEVSACISNMVQNIVDRENENLKECQIIEIVDDVEKEYDIDEIQIVCEDPSITNNSNSADKTLCYQLKEVLADSSDLENLDKSDMEIVNIDCELNDELGEVNVTESIEVENEETESSRHVQVIEINDDENNLSFQTSTNTSFNANNTPSGDQPKLVILSNEVVTYADIASKIIKARQSLDSNSHNATNIVIGSVIPNMMEPNNDCELKNDNDNTLSNDHQIMASDSDCNNIEMIDESIHIITQDIHNEDIVGQADESLVPKNVSSDSIDEGVNTILIEHDSDASECSDDPVEYISTEDLDDTQQNNTSTTANADECDDEVIVVAVEEPDDVNSIFEVIDLTEKNSASDSESLRSSNTKASISSVQRQNLKIVVDLISDLRRSVAESREKVHDLTDDKGDAEAATPKTRAERRKARKQRKSKEKNIRKICLHVKRIIRENMPEKIKKIQQLASNKERSIEDELKMLENLINKRPISKRVHKPVDANAKSTNDNPPNEQPVASQAEPINVATLTKEQLNKNVNQEKPAASPFKKPNNNWFVTKYLKKHTLRYHPYPPNPDLRHGTQIPSNASNWETNIHWETNPVHDTIFHIGQNVSSQWGAQMNYNASHHYPLHNQQNIPQYNNRYGIHQGFAFSDWQQRRPQGVWPWNRPYRPRRFYNKSNFCNKGKAAKNGESTPSEDLSSFSSISETTGRLTSTSDYSEMDKSDIKVKTEIKDELKTEWDNESFKSDCSKLLKDIHIKKEKLDLDIVKVEA